MPEISFVPPVTEIEIVQGNTFEIEQPITNENGDPADLSDYTVTTEVDQIIGDDVAPATVIASSSGVLSHSVSLLPAYQSATCERRNASAVTWGISHA